MKRILVAVVLSTSFAAFANEPAAVEPVKAEKKMKKNVATKTGTTPTTHETATETAPAAGTETAPAKPEMKK